MVTTRTTGPLHFEDLEPHRFEDLVRQLTWRWKSWQLLEATGVKGADHGVDIRGQERMPPGTTPATRLWRIQCKKVKGIKPSEMQELTEELFKDTSVVPYGVVLAAPCDVSADALNKFHESAKKNGAQEHFPWTGRHIEDLLFQPANRDLLFVYFGIQLDPTINDVVDSIVAIQNELIHNLVAARSWTQFSAIGFNNTHYDSAMGRRSFSDAPLELRIQVAHAYAAMAAIAGPMQQRPNTGNWGRPMATHQVYELFQVGPLVGAAIAAIEKAITTIDAFMNKPLKQSEAPTNQA